MNSHRKNTYWCKLLSINTLRMLIVALLFFVAPVSSSAKIKQKCIASVPFETIGTYVVINVKINDSSPLKLIFDSGIRNTIITELTSEDNITLNFANVKELMGLGGGDRLQAYTSNSNTLKIGKLKQESKTVLVLKEDVFNLSSHTGTKINGLIGVDLFQNYIVDVNYGTRRIRFYEKTDSFIAPEKYQKIPISLEDQKMFIQLSVVESDSTRKNVKMLIDTGAELTAWFQTFKKDAVKKPSTGIRGTVGQGLNGEIKGMYGRMNGICLGNYCLENPIVSFVDSSSIASIVDDSERDGTIGSQILSRFNYIIDYNQRQFYFTPNFNFKNKFSYNVAGIEVAQIIPISTQTQVIYVWENSPAALAGVKVGDQIIEINGSKAFQLNVGEVKKIFETPSKRPLKLTVMRDREEITMKIEMNNKL